MVTSAMIQLKRRITLVRIAVARFELTSVTPIFARTPSLLQTMLKVLPKTTIP